MKRAFVVAAALGAALSATEARADGNDAPQPPHQKGVHYMTTVEITAHRQQPVAAIDVSRLPVRLTLESPRQDFVSRIEEVLDKDPF